MIIWSSGFWKTRPARLRMEKRFASSDVERPMTRTSPASGTYSAFTSLPNVDLPLPLPPTIATYSPGWMLIESPSTAFVRLS